MTNGSNRFEPSLPTHTVTSPLRARRGCLRHSSRVWKQRETFKDCFPLLSLSPFTGGGCFLSWQEAINKEAKDTFAGPSADPTGGPRRFHSRTWTRSPQKPWEATVVALPPPPPRNPALHLSLRSLFPLVTLSSSQFQVLSLSVLSNSEARDPASARKGAWRSLTRATVERVAVARRHSLAALCRRHDE